MPYSTGKPKATLRQPELASAFPVSKKPHPALLRDKGNSHGIKFDAEMPPYPVHSNIGNEVFKDIPIQRHVTMSTNSRYLGLYLTKKGSLVNLE